jgi:four helix bundle protein
LSDCDGENNETDPALDFAKDCGYMSPKQDQTLTRTCAEIGRMLEGMMKKMRIISYFGTNRFQSLTGL